MKKKFINKLKDVLYLNSPNFYILIMILIFFISLFIFLLNNTHEQIWYDEALTLHFSNYNINEMLYQIGFNGAEANPPFYHIVIKFIRIIFKDNLFFLRGFSALCGSLLAVFLYYFIEKLFNKKTAALSVIVFITNPIIISFSQELRMYMFLSLITFLNLISFYFFINKKKIYYWIIFLITSILGFYTHYFSFFNFIISFFYMMYYLIKNKNLLKINLKIIIFYFISILIFILAYIPWIPAFLQQREFMSYAVWTESINFFTIFKIFGYFFTTKFSHDVNFIPYIFITLFFMLIISFGIYYQIKNKVNLDKTVFLASCFLIPLIISFTYSFLFYSVINFRYFIMFFPFLIILFVNGINFVPYKKISYLLLSVFILIIIPTVFIIYTSKFNGSAEDTSNYIKKNIIDSNYAVISFEGSTFLTLYYYMNHPDNLFYYSNNKLSECYGTNINKNSYLPGDKIKKVFEENDSIFLVITPWSKKTAYYLIEHNKDFIINDKLPPIIFKNKYSWFRHKVIHIIKK